VNPLTENDLTELVDALDAFRDMLVARDYEPTTATELTESALPIIADIVAGNAVGEDYS
jgi:hypothetical protein